MSKAFRVVATAASNALRADGYRRAVRGGLPLGERARRYYRRRAAAQRARAAQTKGHSHATVHPSSALA